MNKRIKVGRYTMTRQTIIDVADWCKSNAIHYYFCEGNDTGNVWKDLEYNARNPKSDYDLHPLNLIMCKVSLAEKNVKAFEAEWNEKFLEIDQFVKILGNL